MAPRTPPEEIRFPVVIMGKALITSLRVERLAMLNGENRFASGHSREEAQEILADARADDPADRRLDGVLVRLLRQDFVGASYGLALAVADKRARFPTGAPRRLVATGAIAHGGEGRLAAIEGFDAKVAAVLAECGAEDGVTFLFPTANWREASDETRAALEAARAAGAIDFRHADDLSDLADLWDAPAVAPEPVSAPEPLPAKGARRLWIPLAAGATAAAALGGAGLWWFSGEPLRRCETAIAKLDAATGDTSALLVGTIETCDASLHARPNDGRLLFLIGQLHAVNGSEALAEKYWLRSAESGDKDGLATWGRHLWLSNQDDPAVVSQALDYLNGAATKGSAAALEDMAEIYTEGRAFPVDVAKAQAHLAKARAIRQKEKS